jgi:uncharacterized protein HemY
MWPLLPLLYPIGCSLAKKLPLNQQQVYEIECNAHKQQTMTYYQLGAMAQQRRQWKQAERYYHDTLVKNP